MLEARIERQLRTFGLRLELSVQAGDCLAIVGPSGSGKSSALASIAGLPDPDSGAVGCGGVPWFDSGAGRSLPTEERGCGFVFQDYALFGHLTAAENVGFALTALPRKQRAGRAVELLGRFGVADLADARPCNLSGGERQRVALARALACDPAVLLLDEPLSALDATTRAAATRQLRELIDAAGVPAVLVTHDFVESATLATEIAVIEAGQIVQRDTAENLAARPGSPFVADLVGSVVLTGTAQTGAGGSTEVQLDGGGIATSSDSAAAGPVAIAVHPWDIALEDVGASAHGSPRNRLRGTVTSVTTIGGRVRVGIDAGQPIAAEVTATSRDELRLEPGREIAAFWKATATRIVPR